MYVRMLAIAALVCALLPGFFPDAFAQPSQPYAKGATWQQTVLDARSKCQAWHKEWQASHEIVFGPWFSSGPLKAKAFTDALFPEQGVSLDAKTIDGRPRWTEHGEWMDGVVHDLSADGTGPTYLYRIIKTDKPCTVSAGFGSDDGLEVWLNGNKLLSNDVARGAAPEQDKLDLALQVGENKLLFKVYNRLGGHAFCFSILNNPVYAMNSQLERDFPAETAWVLHDTDPGARYALLEQADSTEFLSKMISRALNPAGIYGAALRPDLDALVTGRVSCDDPRWLDLYVRACKVRPCANVLNLVSLAALRLAIQDLSKSFPDQYTKGEDYLARLDAFEKDMPALTQLVIQDPDASWKQINELTAFQREVLLANPLLDFDRLLVVKRNEGMIGLPQNWQGNCAIPSQGYDNEIAILSPLRGEGALSTFYRPENGGFVGNVYLNYDADKMLFSMPGGNGRWQIWELKSDGSGLHQLTAGEEPDVDNYDACYLPDGRITFGSTRCFQGVPCVGGGNTVANLCRMDADGQNTRQLCFDQDHNWCPTVLNNGRVMYSRWEYSDTPHYFSRILFNMNPDGTNQCEYYGSNSYWPNSIFYARPIPGHPSAVAAIISGHHGVPRMGELIILDPAKSRFEGDGVVQRIPGYGKKVEPVIMDTLVDNVWPKFLHPYPLSEKYLIVSCKPTSESRWGIYLVDVFDNMQLLCEVPGYALLEPVAFRATPRPPVIPDKVDLNRTDATVYLTDVYSGQGLKGVPRGMVKKLRVFEIYYTYPQMGGHINVGVEGPWDVHRILGTVPVYEDGSAFFKIPANIPVAVQPLDAEGKAVQLMRSWFVGMPGETVSCVGCHERQNMTPPAVQTLASRQAAVDITPWKGPARGFSFKRDVQPVLDKHCVGCHNGADRADGLKLPDFARKDKNGWGNFTPSYLALHPYVRRPGPESDYHVQKPTEFSASTSELIQMLEKGHHGVKLDADAWERLYAWIDLNVPDHGTWGEHHTIPANFHERRLAMRGKYANRPEDPEIINDLNQEPVAFVPPTEPAAPAPDGLTSAGWPFDAKAAAERQQAAGTPVKRSIDLGNGVAMEFVLVPAGEFVMGTLDGTADERPRAVVKVDAPFWMGTLEVTNAQYQQFDPNHDNGFLDQQNKDHTMPGYSIQAPNDPAVRISWNEAGAFCQWLSQRTGTPCTLPTEAQWEWACRAGSDTPFWYGTMDTDFSAKANLADLSIRRLAVAGINPQPIDNPSPYEDFLPKDSRFNDGERIMTEAGKYQPNPWGLFDMHGNVAEWTLSNYRPYPYAAEDGRNDVTAQEKKVVRGGSWFDRPKRAQSSFRLGYAPWQPVYNVGFRVILSAAAH